MLAKIPLDLIDLGERGRKDYGDLDEMISDIKRRGLICPIAVINKSKAGLDVGNLDLPFLLAAGGRRLASVTALKWTEIDCRVFERPMTELDYREIELYENLKRKSLTPKEEFNMKDELHNLLVEIHGPKVLKTPDAPGQSIADTAEMLGVDSGNLARELKLKRTMDKFPEIDWDKCKTKSDVQKLASKLTRTLTNAHAAEEVTRKMNNGVDSLVKTVCDSFVVGDFFEKIQSFPDGSFGLCEIDPPYAINLTAKKKGNTCYGYNEVDASEYARFMGDVLRICYAKLKTNSWLICWFGPDPWYPVIRDLLELSGFGTTGLVGVWGKGAEEEEIISSACGQTHMPLTRLANAYELFYYAWKGKPELSKPGSSNLFGCAPTPHRNKWHPTQRPRPLIRDLLSTFAPPGSHVLVPFAGSGETILSAYKEKMFATGFELNPVYKDSFVIEAGKEFG